MRSTCVLSERDGQQQACAVSVGSGLVTQGIACARSASIGTETSGSNDVQWRWPVGRSRSANAAVLSSARTTNHEEDGQRSSAAYSVSSNHDTRCPRHGSVRAAARGFWRKDRSASSVCRPVLLPRPACVPDGRRPVGRSPAVGVAAASGCNRIADVISWCALPALHGVSGLPVHGPGHGTR